MQRKLLLALAILTISISNIYAEEPVKLSISKTQENEVKRIHDFFLESLDREKEDYTFVIQESDILNAYASLGKKVIITTALIKKLETEAGLAFVIAHEIGHVERKHVVQGIARNGLGAILKMIFFRESSTATAVYDTVNFLHSKSYSRGKEKKADLFAVELINKHYCNAPGKLEFFRTISKENQEQRAAEYLSTHPLPESRIEYLEAEIQAAGCKV